MAAAPSHRRRLGACVAFICFALWRGAAIAAETTVVTRLSCSPEVAEDAPREPKERMYDYRRFVEVAHSGDRDILCFPGGDYTPEQALERARARLSAALVALGAPSTAPPQFLSWWQRAPDEKVPLTDVTRVSVELAGCIRPATDNRWICRVNLRTWYFKPGMSRESVFSELVVLATAATDLVSARYPFAPQLSLDSVTKGKPPMDPAMVFP